MPDLAALHDAFACCTTAVLQAWRGNRDPALLSLREAQAAAEDAFGSGSSEADALSVVFAAIRHAADRGAGSTADAASRHPLNPAGRRGAGNTAAALGPRSDPTGWRS